MKDLVKKSKPITAAYEMQHATTPRKKRFEKALHLQAKKELANYETEKLKFMKLFAKFDADNAATTHFYYVFCTEFMMVQEKQNVPFQTFKDFFRFENLCQKNEVEVVTCFIQTGLFAQSYDFAFWLTFEYFRKLNFIV